MLKPAYKGGDNMNRITKRIVTLLLVSSLSMLLSIVGCKSASGTSSAPSYNPTQTGSQEVSSFLLNAQSRYEANPESQIIGISSSDFLSLKVQSDSVILLNDKSYDYCVSRIGNPATLSIDFNLANYAISYAPSYGSTGSLPIQVTVHQDKNLIGEFTFQEDGALLNSSPVFLEAYQVGDLLFLFLYYTPASTASFESLWLVLLPANS